MPTNWYDYAIYQGFKWTWNKQAGHSGVDLPMPVGTPITSPVTGVVAGNTYHDWGGQVDIRTTIGGQTYIISFLHLSQIVSTLQLNQRVEPGQLLGWSGGVNKGAHPTKPAYSNGAHLHFELTYGDTPPYTTYNPRKSSAAHHPVDPSGYIAALKAHGITNQPQNLPVATDTTGGASFSPEAATTPATTPSGAAHQLLVEVPGFEGIVTALDVVEQFTPYDPSGWPWDQAIYPFKWVTQNAAVLVIRALIFGLGLILLVALIIAVLAQNKWAGEAALTAVTL